MRLIDADAITEDERQEHGFFYNSDLQELLDEQPTIDISNTSNTSNTLGALDCVDRQKAIDAVKFGITYAKAFNKSTGEVKELFKEGNKALNEAAERLKELPSAQPRKGKWIDSGYGVECSLCGEWYPHASIARNQLNFCPNCGSYNGGEQE